MKICTSIVTAGALLLLGCSGGAKAEKSDESVADTKPAEDAPKSSSTTELAPCLVDGAIPLDATNCMLSLNLVSADAGKDSYWIDSDGLDPGTAGCMQEYTTDACTERKSAVTMGEFCVDADRLIESTAAAGECHVHEADASTPQVVSCSAWCATQGNAGGRCEPFVQVEGPSGTCESARCTCD